MRVEHLFYFTKTVELSSLTLASENLYLSPQALSSAIKNLEKDFGVKLFNRTHSGLTVTDEGLYIYQQAKQVLSIISEMETHFTENRLLNLDETLTIALVPSVKDTYLSKVITYFYKNHPHIKLSFVYSNNHDIIQTIANGEADIGFYNLLNIGQDALQTFPAEVIFTPFAKHSYELITSIDSPLAAYASISMKTISKHPLVFFADLLDPDSCHATLIKYYNLADNAIVVDSNTLLFQMILDNLANAILPHIYAAAKTNVAHIPITDNIKILTGYLINSGTQNKKSADLFIDKLLQLVPKSIVVH